VFLVLAPLGAVALVAWLNGLTGRDRWINGAALAGFAAAQTVSPEAWQRYYEPMLLILLPLWAFSEHRTDGTTRPVRTGRIAGPIALALLLGAVSAWTLTRQDKITQPQLDPQYVSPEELERTNVPR
jgi:hypothetical protein